MIKRCSVNGCDRNSVSNQMCRMHYQRVKRTGSVEIKRQHEKHGMWSSREYKSWDGMLKRCSSKRGDLFKNYAGRGISVCEEWKKSFSKFFEDMGPCPEGHQIDRIDNDGNYCKENCRWASRAENMQNRRCTKFSREDIIEIRNSNLPQREIAKKFNTNHSVISRIKSKKTWANIE